MPSSKLTLKAAALMGALAVALGAFGAHALKDLLTQFGRKEIYELAVRYHFFHTLALLFLGLMMERNNKRSFRLAALLLISGILLFSGSLYLLAVTNQAFFAYITPLGGLLLIGGWLSILYGLFT